MKKFFQKIWNHPIWSSVIGAGIYALFHFLWEYLPIACLFTLSIFIQIWQFIISSTPIPHWLIGLTFFLCVFFSCVNLKHIFFHKNSHQEYIFFELCWLWHDSGNGIEVSCSLCPYCKYEIIPRDDSSSGLIPRFKYECECDGCRKFEMTLGEDWIDLSGKVKLKIEQEIRTGKLSIR